MVKFSKNIHLVLHYYGLISEICRCGIPLCSVFAKSYRWIGEGVCDSLGLSSTWFWSMNRHPRPPSFVENRGFGQKIVRYWPYFDIALFKFERFLIATFQLLYRTVYRPIQQLEGWFQKTCQWCPLLPPFCWCLIRVWWYRKPTHGSPRKVHNPSASSTKWVMIFRSRNGYF